jgi:hypothetical protein
MRIRQLAVRVLLFGCVACIHRPSSATVLRPLSADYISPAGSLETQYVVFADRFTQGLFGSTQSLRRLRVAPSGTALLCPGVRADGLHGFRVRIYVERSVRDTAVGVVEQHCQEATYSSLYSLVKQRGRWRIAKALGGSVSQ